MHIKFHTTKRRRLRTWWLVYGSYVLCPGCNWSVIPIEEVWCGCRPMPRKLKKWCKKRRAAYSETM